MDNRQKKLAQQRIEVLRKYLAGPAAQDFVRNLAVGGVNIFDFRKTIRTTDDVFSLMTLIISVLQTKKGLEEEPFVFVINEAHDYFKGGVSADFVESIEHLVRRKRHGRNWLLLDTHFPDDVDDKIIQLADLKFVHYLDKATTSGVLTRAFGKHTSEFSNLPIGQAFVEADVSSEGLSQVFRVTVRPRLTMHGGATKTAV
jgi:DNA helicase HerA-like ATPase